jgi:hypothetical protein
MTTSIIRAIELAVGGGLNLLKYGYSRNDVQLGGFLIEGEKVIISATKQPETPYETERAGQFWIHYTQIFSDPLFWQALGKARGWGEYDSEDTSHDCDALGCSSIEHNVENRWSHHWHRFIDHLIAGKDHDSFFAELLSPNPNK